MGKKGSAHSSILRESKQGEKVGRPSRLFPEQVNRAEKGGVLLSSISEKK